MNCRHPAWLESAVEYDHIASLSKGVKDMKRGKESGLPFVLPGIAWVTIFTVLPLLYLLYLSFSDYRVVREPIFVGLENYARMLEDRRLLQSIGVTLVFTLGSTFLTLVLGIGAAWIFSYDVPGIRFLRALFTAPLFAAPVAVATIARLLFAPSIGLLGREPILGNPSTAQFALIAVDAWQWTPLVFVVALSALRAVPIHEIESARLDTRSHRAIFSSVMLPRVNQALLLVALLRLIESYRMLDLPFILTGGGPGMTTQTLALSVFDNSFRNFNIGYGSAIAVVMMIPILIAAAIFFALLRTRFEITKPRTIKSYLEALRQWKG